MFLFDLDQSEENLNEFLSSLEEGQQIVVTRRGKVVAHLSPSKKSKKTLTLEALKELAEFRSRMPRLSPSLTEVLIEMRNEYY